MQKTKWCVFDTEGSGLFDWSKPADDEGQPRLAHFAGILLNEEMEETDRVNIYFKPNGWSMTPEATDINGLTDEFLMEHGVDAQEGLLRYLALIDQGYAFAAFNARHDMKAMRAELRRHGMDDRFEQTLNTCLMRSCGTSTVPKESGKKGWPKLSDVLAHIGETNPAPHTGMADAEAALAVFYWLAANDMLLEPQVHYAKNRDA